jgi:hypothetical protein
MNDLDHPIALIVPDWAGYCDYRDAFREVMDERYYTLPWLDQQVLDGKVQFWRTDNAGCITEIREYPTGAKDLHALIGAGDLGEIIGEIFPRAEAWGKARGCIGAIVESREGWARALKPHGYTLYQTTVRKEL